jgi:hypothetical protein
MALNFNALKALFSKLKPAAKAVAPVADDIAKGVANYGDDAARLIANNADDAARLANYGDDVARVVDNGNNFLSATPTDLVKTIKNQYRSVPRSTPKVDDISNIARPWIPNTLPGMVKRFQHVADNFVARNRYPTTVPISSVDGLRDSSNKLLSLYDRLQNRVNLSYGLPSGTPLDENLGDRIFNTSLRFPRSVEVNSLYKDIDLSDITDPRVPRTYF